MGPGNGAITSSHWLRLVEAVVAAVGQTRVGLRLLLLLLASLEVHVRQATHARVFRGLQRHGRGGQLVVAGAEVLAELVTERHLTQVEATIRARHKGQAHPQDKIKRNLASSSSPQESTPSILSTFLIQQLAQ